MAQLIVGLVYQIYTNKGLTQNKLFFSKLMRIHIHINHKIASQFIANLQENRS